MTVFEWDEAKNQINQQKHGVSFQEAEHAFLDPKRIIAKDVTHSTPEEERLYCIGKITRLVDDQEAEGILTVRFTYREDKIRIIGAGFWRKQKRYYERRRNSLHR